MYSIDLESLGSFTFYDIDMAEIKAVPLGAGQDVGRSCIIVTLGGKNIMLDCGMHMGFNDDRKFPDFSYIAKTGPYTPYIDCLIISHFHLGTFT